MDPRVLRVKLGEFLIPKRLQAVRLYADDAVAWDYVQNLPDHLLSKNREIADYPPLAGIGRGLAWVGPAGTGKTTRATATLIEVYLTWGVPVMFVAYADYISMRKEQWSLANKAGEAERWNEIQRVIEGVREVPVLMLDDVGKEHDGASGFASKELDLLLRQRHRDALPTLITTNVAFSDWAAVYNESMGSFVQEAFALVDCVGEDHRVGSAGWTMTTKVAPKRSSNPRR